MARTIEKSPPERRPPRSTKAPETTDGAIQGPVLRRANYVLLGIALAVIALGFVTLGTGSTTAAPILLVLGYLVLVPFALVKR